MTRRPIFHFFRPARGGGVGLVLLWASLVGCGGGAAQVPDAAGGDAGPGDGGGGSACTSGAACGGDLKGTWRVASTCFTAAGKTMLGDSLKLCSAGTASLDRASASGTVTYDAQGAVKYDLVLSFDASATLPPSCIAAADSCASIQAKLLARNGVTAAACQTMGAGCACTFSATVAKKREGSYETRASSVIETDPSDGSMETHEYCVSGNTLRVQDSKEIDVWTR